MRLHTNIRTTQLYAKVLVKKVSEDMAPLMEKFVSRHIKYSEVTELQMSDYITLIRRTTV